MKKKKVYLSAPITHYDLFERKKFFAAQAAAFPDDLFEVINPMELSIPEGASYGDIMRIDIAELIKCDCICMCEGWQHSRGCNLEHHIAVVLGIDIIYINK